MTSGGPSGASRLPVTVSVGDDHSLAEVAGRLRRAGLDVTETLEPLHLLVGTAAPDRIAALRAVEGVEAVELEQGYQLAPPDSEVQ